MGEGTPNAPRLIIYSRILVSDIGDILFAALLCKVLQGMERDLPCAEQWARRIIYSVGVVLAVLSGIRLIGTVRSFSSSGWHRSSLLWASEVFAFVYLSALCGILVVAVIFQQHYNPCNYDEYEVSRNDIFCRTIAGSRDRRLSGPR